VRINIVSPSFVGYRGHEIFAGGQVLLWELTKLLADHGHNVTVIQWGDEDREFDFHHTHIRQIRVPEPEWLVKAGITRLFQTYGFFWKGHLDRDADLVHLHYYNNAFPFATDDMTGMCHGIDWDCPNPKLSWGPRALRDRFHLSTMKAIARFGIRRLKRIAANDLFFLKYVQSEMPQYRDKIWHIPNFVDLDLFNGRIHPATDLVDRFRDSFKVLVPKFVMHQRGQHLAIQALSRLNGEDVVLLLAGDPPTGRDRTYYDRLIEEHARPGQVIYLGHRDHFKEMPAIHRAADVVLVPSHCREATALSLLEGMASEKAVIVTNVGGLPDAVIDGHNGLICPPTPDGVANALLRLIHDARLRAALAKEAASWVARFYAKEIWQRKWLEFLGLELQAVQRTPLAGNVSCAG